MTWKIVTMCTHNRTRSVLAAALLADHLWRAGVTAEVFSAGQRDAGLPATPETVRLLAKRGLDASRHRSRTVDASLVEEADLILTAEPQHVVSVAGRWQTAFDKTFVLPELLRLAQPVGPLAGRDLVTWLAEVGTGRPTGAAYLTAEIDGIADPTGQSAKVWRASFDEIDAMCERLAMMLR